MIRTRIAPSPTGFLHIGTARTALFNYLFAKRSGGAFVLRVEDTDLERSDPKYERDIFAGLAWLGIAADESPERGGKFGPYRQSERVSSYSPYLERLIASGTAYYCPHTGTELDAEKKALSAAGQNPVHRCSYRDGGAAPSGGAIIRFKTPSGRRMAFDDFIRGKIEFTSDLLGDFSIAKDASTPLYNFAVTIDDHEMAISHVIRGEDHISNTPKQMLIAEALGLALPVYAHLPLILGQDRSKLSKRHGATAVHEFREQGYLPEALVNFMALLGWNPGTERELFAMDELIEHFDLTRTNKGGAVFNIDKLDWMNGEYIRKKTPAEFVGLVRQYVPDADEKLIERVAALEQPRLKKLSEFAERTGYFFASPDCPPELLRWKAMDDDGVRASLKKARSVLNRINGEEFTRQNLERHFIEAVGAGDKGELLWPLRAALTGQKASPGPFEIMEVLGKEASLRRIDLALEKLGLRPA